jgi:hypothetical protein
MEIAHFGPVPLEHLTAQWALLDHSGAAVAEGVLPPATIPIGNGKRLGTAQVNLAGLTPGHQYRLVAGCPERSWENDWDLWVFADRLDTQAPDSILVSECLDAQALHRLAAGGTVLLMPPAQDINTDCRVGFSSVFWNTAWTGNQAPHTLGILCDHQHPIFARFPTEDYSNWQWWELIHGSAAMVLDHLPPDLRPLVQPIDTWFENRRLGLLFEARVNNGKLMVCSMDLRSDLEHRLVARQMRHSVLHYMQSPYFDPPMAVEVTAIETLFHKRA